VKIISTSSFISTSLLRNDTLHAKNDTLYVNYYDRHYDERIAIDGEEEYTDHHHHIISEEMQVMEIQEIQVQTLEIESISEISHNNYENDLLPISMSSSNYLKDDSDYHQTITYHLHEAKTQQQMKDIMKQRCFQYPHKDKSVGSRSTVVVNATKLYSNKEDFSLILDEKEFIRYGSKKDISTNINHQTEEESLTPPYFEFESETNLHTLDTHSNTYENIDTINGPNNVKIKDENVKHYKTETYENPPNSAKIITSSYNDDINQITEILKKLISI